MDTIKEKLCQVEDLRRRLAAAAQSVWTKWAKTGGGICGLRRLRLMLWRPAGRKSRRFFCAQQEAALLLHLNGDHDDDDDDGDEMMEIDQIPFDMMIGESTAAAIKKLAETTDGDEGRY